MSSLPLIQIGVAQRPLPDGLDWRERVERLREWFRAHGSALVAYSGGVDSSLVLRIASETLGDRALGVIGRSDSYSGRELALALDQAQAIGARVETVTTGELSDPNFSSNPVNRCYHCKSELYRKLAAVAERVRADVVVDGTIADDVLDWRPGRLAASENAVRSPLAELGFTKEDVRAAAREMGLVSHDKPASPCLASRIPYGQEITREKLSMVEQAEEALRSLGFAQLRVRHHEDVARIEIPAAEIPRLLEPGAREAVAGALRALGYRYVTLDLEGFRSGSLNEGFRPQKTTN